MKIAWFTPFEKKSAIGRVSAEICDELSKTHKVDIWTQHSIDLHETVANIVSYKGIPNIKELSQYDYVLYNLGNFAGYHRDIMEVAKQLPGIIILHDQTMSSFWAQYYLFQEYGGDPINGVTAYVELFRRHYDEKEAMLVEKACNSGHFPVYDYPGINDFDLIEPCIENSLGVFTHAGFFINRLRDISNIPMSFSYLPCPKLNTEALSNSEVNSIIAKARAQGRRILVSNGIVHPVKRIDKITAVLEANPQLADKICYLVIGSYGGEYGNNLENLSKSKLKDCLYMLGYQPENEMHAALSAADLCANLRYPNSEVCSLSLLEQMSFNKPVMVLNSGVFGEMPENTVIKLRLENEEKDIERTLTRFLNGDLELDKIGQNAGKFIKENCNTKVYCARLISFLNKIQEEQAVVRLQDRFLASVGTKIAECSILDKKLPGSYTMIVKTLGGILSERKHELSERVTIGVWAGFKYAIPGLNREGISRFISYLITTLIHNYELDCEIWCYSYNEEEMRICFSEILNSPLKNRLVIITEKNWKDIFKPNMNIVNIVGDIEENSNLANAARYVSRASVFLPIILYLDDVINIEKKVFVPAHDMAVAAHYDEFIERDPLYKARHLDILWRAERLARYGAVFFSNSDIVRKNQILKYVNGLSEKDTATVYLPVNIPKGIMERLQDEANIRKKFDIKGRYMYYPTQIRPYKNVSTLIKAFNRIKEEYSDLVLVLTGRPADVPEVDDLINKFELTNKVVLVGAVSEEELYSLYRYADAVPVPSLFEGGLPWQACEALFFNAPLVLSNIDVVIERMRFHGYEPEQSGIYLFDPTDDIQLAEGLRYVLENKAEVIEKQKPFAKALISYDWNEAAKRYFRLFFEQG